MLDETRPFLLADMGTNGEFVLARPPRPDQDPADPPPLLAASVPLGPALEGVGLRCGGPAGPGGVTAFRAGPEGLTAVVSGGKDGDAPRHICGTGYPSLIRLLLQSGLLDADGRFRPDAPAEPGPLAISARPPAASLRPDTAPGSTGELLLPLPGKLFLSAGDVEAVLQVKAAFSLAVERLLAEAGLAPTDFAASAWPGPWAARSPGRLGGSAVFCLGHFVPRPRGGQYFPGGRGAAAARAGARRSAPPPGPDRRRPPGVGPGLRPRLSSGFHPSHALRRHAKDCMSLPKPCFRRPRPLSDAGWTRPPEPWTWSCP